MANSNNDLNTAVEAALHRTKDRRTSVIQEVQHEDGEEPPKVVDAWDIACPEQVAQYAKDYPGRFWNYIQNLRSERYEFRDYPDRLQVLWEQYKELEAKYNRLDAAHKEMKADYQKSEEELSTAQDQVSKYRKELLRLRRLVNELHNEVLEKPDLDQGSHPDQSQEASRSAKGQKSLKLPDPPVFTDGKDPTWDDWSVKVREKLEANADRYTEEFKVAYVLNRLGGEAATYTYRRREKGASNPYLAFEDILAELGEIYETTLPYLPYVNADTPY